MAEFEHAGFVVAANLGAGGADHEAVERALEVLRGNGPVEFVDTSERPGPDAVLEHRAGRTLVVIGGDGSVHAAISALHRRGDLSDCTIGLIPLGTGNDLARNLGIPLGPEDAARTIVGGHLRRLDLLVDDAGGVVVNAAHAGVGAEAAEAASPLKARLGPLAFPVGALTAGTRTAGWRLHVEVDGEVLTEARTKVLMVAVANAPGVAGGTAQLAPGAVPDDGLADVVVSTSLRPLARISYAVRLHRGRHIDRPDVTTARGHRITVRGEPFPLNADGEVSGPHRSRTWTVVPAAWQLIVPGESAGDAG